MRRSSLQWAIVRGAVATLLAFTAFAPALAQAQEVKVWDLAKGDYPHDVAIGPAGEVWFAG